MSQRTLTTIFVYGTLKRNLPNQPLMADEKNGVAQFITNGTTNAPYPMVIGTRWNIPFLVDQPHRGHRVQGEIFAVDERMQATLDVFEGHPHYYLRKPIEVTRDDDGSVIECAAYMLTNYPADFLEGRQLLSNYVNPANQAYVLPSLRPDTPKAKDDLGYRP